MSQASDELAEAKEKRRILIEAMETLLDQGRNAADVTVDELWDLVDYFEDMRRSDIEEYLRVG